MLTTKTLPRTSLATLLWSILFAFLLLWHSRTAASYDALPFYSRALAPLALCLLATLLITWDQPLDGKAILLIPAVILAFGVAAQAIWMKAWCTYVEVHPALQRRWPQPELRQSTWVIAAAFLLAIAGAAGLAWLNHKYRLEERYYLLVAFILGTLPVAWLPLLVTSPWIYELNKITYVIAMSAILNLPRFDRRERLKLVISIAYTGLFLVPLLLKGESEIGSLLIIGATFFVLTLCHMSSVKRFLVGAAAALPMITLLGVLIAGKKMMRRVDEWLHFMAWGADSQQYLGMRGVLMGGMFGGDRRYLSYVPEGDNDFIASVLVQCFGAIFGAVLILLVLALVLLGLRTAFRERDSLQRGMAFGFSVMLGVQSLLMWGVNLVLLPISGNTQPWASSGGGALFAAFFMADILFLLFRKQYLESHPDGRRIKA